MTDYKQLICKFSSNRSLLTLSAMRIIHYAIFLQAFDNIIKYRNSQKHISEADVYNLSQIEIVPVTASNIAKAILLDKISVELSLRIKDSQYKGS